MFEFQIIRSFGEVVLAKELLEQSSFYVKSIVSKVALFCGVATYYCLYYLRDGINIEM